MRGTLLLGCGDSRAWGMSLLGALLPTSITFVAKHRDRCGITPPRPSHSPRAGRRYYGVAAGEIDAVFRKTAARSTSPCATDQHPGNRRCYSPLVAAR